MTDQPEKLDLSSHDVAEDKRQELLRLFPEVGTEGGKVDFERLKLALGEAMDVGKERYGMNWPGKADCFKAIQSLSLGTLLPCPARATRPTDPSDMSGGNVVERTSVSHLLVGDLWIMAGQSNMDGCAKLVEVEPPSPLVHAFYYDDHWDRALQV